MWVIDAIGHYFHNGVESTWHWVCTLNHQEWLLLLGFGAAAGFLCMRGLSSHRI
jgi:hypothetical protein